MSVFVVIAKNMRDFSFHEKLARGIVGVLPAGCTELRMVGLIPSSHQTTVLHWT